MPLIGIMGAGDEKWVPREKINSLLDILRWLYLRGLHSCADVWQTTGNVGLELKEKVIKKLDEINEWIILKLNPYA